MHRLESVLTRLRAIDGKALKAYHIASGLATAYITHTFFEGLHVMRYKVPSEQVPWHTTIFPTTLGFIIGCGFPPIGVSATTLVVLLHLTDIADKHNEQVFDKIHQNMQRK